MNTLRTLTLSLLTGSCIVANNHQTTSKENSPVHYLFSHGLADTGAQVKRYLTEQTSPAQNAPQDETKTIAEKPPKNPENQGNTASFSPSENVYTLDSGCVAHVEKNTGQPITSVLGHPYATFDYPDATTSPWRIKFWKTSLAQKEEVACLSRVYNLLINNAEKPQELGKNNDIRLVLFGLSRGASAAINFVATTQPSNITAMILESPFDTPVSVVKNNSLIKMLPTLKAAPSLIHILLRMSFWQYREDGLAPINLVSKIPHTLPILLVASKADKTVPFECTLALYKALKTSGHPHTHILILPTGKHAQLIDDHFTCYRDTAHAFYRHYNLPHNTTYAESGMVSFEQTQP